MEDVEGGEKKGEGSENMKRMIWACIKCRVAFPDALPYRTKKCPYCDGELKLHRVPSKKEAKT